MLTRRGPRQPSTLPPSKTLSTKGRVLTQDEGALQKLLELLQDLFRTIDDPEKTSQFSNVAYLNLRSFRALAVRPLG